MAQPDRVDLIQPCPSLDIRALAGATGAMRFRSPVGAGRIDRRQPTGRLDGWTAYRASKSALSHILRTLAIKVASSRPEAIVVSMPPGTVTSGLSRPLWPDPTAIGVFSPEESAAYLLRVLDGLCWDDTGGVFA